MVSHNTRGVLWHGMFVRGRASIVQHSSMRVSSNFSSASHSFVSTTVTLLEVKKLLRHPTRRILVLGIVSLFGVLLVPTTFHPIPTATSPKEQRRDVPFPPKSSPQVTVVLMNHNRPYLLQQSDLLPVLTSHPSVEKVLLLHSNSASAFTNKELQQKDITNIAKIQHINAVAENAVMGLAIRFQFCATVRTDWVVLVDDDMELHPAAISILVRSMMEDPHRIVGHYGRRYNANLTHRHGYDTHTVYGKVEVVLTKAMILEKPICEQFLQKMDVVHDLVPDSRPMWNGEDIFVNLVANQYYTNVNSSASSEEAFRNLAIPDLPVWDVDTSKYSDEQQQQHSISGNMDRVRRPNRQWNVLHSLLFWRDNNNDSYQKARAQADAHTYYRGKLWYTAKTRLAAAAANTI